MPKQDARKSARAARKPAARPAAKAGAAKPTARPAAKAGANVVAVLGAASDETIAECVEAGKRYDARIMVDLAEVADPVARARRAKGELIWVNEQHRNALTRCIGQTTPLEVDLITRQLEVGEKYFFCSDGITRLLKEEEIAEHLSRDDQPADILQEIVELTNVRGGLDNATGVMVCIDQLP